MFIYVALWSGAIKQATAAPIPNQLFQVKKENLPVYDLERFGGWLNNDLSDLLWGSFSVHSRHKEMFADSPH